MTVENTTAAVETTENAETTVRLNQDGTPRKERGTRPSNEIFVRKWMEVAHSGSYRAPLVAIAEYFDLSTGAVSGIASELRNKFGVRLPKLTAAVDRGVEKVVATDDLNALIDSFGDDGATDEGADEVLS